MHYPLPAAVNDILANRTESLCKYYICSCLQGHSMHDENLADSNLHDPESSLRLAFVIIIRNSIEVAIPCFQWSDLNIWSMRMDNLHLEPFHIYETNTVRTI